MFSAIAELRSRPRLAALRGRTHSRAVGELALRRGLRKGAQNDSPPTVNHLSLKSRWWVLGDR